MMVPQPHDGGTRKGMVVPQPHDGDTRKGMVVPQPHDGAAHNNLTVPQPHDGATHNNLTVPQPHDGAGHRPQAALPVTWFHPAVPHSHQVGRSGTLGVGTHPRTETHVIKLGIINATASSARRGTPIADWVEAVARRCGAFAVQRINLWEVDLPLFDEAELPRLRTYRQPHTLAWSEQVDALDAFIIVMPEYNRGYPAILKNAIDYLAQEWAFKPVGIVSYGTTMSGGMRGAQALIDVLTAMQMYPVREQVVVPYMLSYLVDDVFQPTEGMQQGAEAMCESLVRANAAMHLLRTDLEEVGDQQGVALHDVFGTQTVPHAGRVPGAPRDDREAWRQAGGVGPESGKSVETFRDR
ncbi:NADPH-dependent oxidoreductase [Buchananella hordeovulneris]|uniref:NADPH-dependent FMN reductase n=1 Tax=Buchananella hordeovulneris TaxID=52770 RepID=UPI000F5F9B7E|nr:NAD(P)H-dependent oxidoreductase [Buchananella hordeovulneris]RRD53198.1 NADPH-dependent oxidoreductase [Buchananella hordeovulneris]